MSVKNPISANITGTGTLACKGFFGGAILSANGTNAATMIVREENATGTVLLHVVVINPVFFDICIKCESGKIYYSISGTGASGMLYGQRVA